MSHDLGPYLREQRKQRGISLRAMARRCDVSAVYLSMVERGQKRGSEDVLRRYAVQLGTTLDNLLLTANRVPSDVLQILENRPDLWNYLRSLVG